MAKTTKKQEAAMKAEHDVAKAKRTQALERLLFFVLACGSIASTIVLTMLISESDIEAATNVVAVLNALAGAYFVGKLIFN